MHGSRRIFLALLATGLPLSGCGGVAHNDTLLFGTQTKLGFDISAAPEQGQVPELTIGYKRKEAVWMPLFVNARHSAAFSQGQPVSQSTATATTTPATMALAAVPADGEAVAELLGQYKYRGQGETASDRGADSYSVFASFGAQFEGSGSAAEVEAGGGVAQFFATGIAAQRLAKAPQVQELVRVKAPSQQQLEAAEERAGQAETRLEAILGQPAVQAAIEQGRRQAADRTAKIQLVMSYVAPGGDLDRDRLLEALDEAGVEENDPQRSFILEGTNASEVRERLSFTDPLIDPLFQAVQRLQEA